MLKWLKAMISADEIIENNKNLMKKLFEIRGLV
jgi:hypothetical protein